MASAVSWYGPLIDISNASSHVGSFVQLLVFVHHSSPIQYKLSKRGDIVRTDVRVGDETRPHFTLSIWQKHIDRLAIPGHVILLQNVKIAKFEGHLSARTVYCSSIKPLVVLDESLGSKNVDDLIVKCRVGMMAEAKLRRVVEWVKTSGFIPKHKKQLARNWKVVEEGECRDCGSISEVLQISRSIKVVFNASIGEIFLPLANKAPDDVAKEMMFMSQRLNMEVANLVEDMICTGCQLCGSPLELDPSKPAHEQNSVPLYCEKSANRLHSIGMIYRPFVLYVWDEMDYIPLLVKNKAAEILFGNIQAQAVYNCLKKKLPSGSLSDARAPQCHTIEGPAGSESFVLDSGYSGQTKKVQCYKGKNFLSIWFVLVKILLQQGKNSPSRLTVNINVSLEREYGRFELIYASMPFLREKKK